MQRPSGQLSLPAWQLPPASCACTPADGNEPFEFACGLLAWLHVNDDDCPRSWQIELPSMSLNSANGQSGVTEAYPRPGDGVRREEDPPHDMHQRLDAAAVNVLACVCLQRQERV